MIRNTGEEPLPEYVEPAAHAAAGGRIGRYLVVEQIGQGGMGVIYAAYDPQLDRKIAIKVLGGRHSASSVNDAQARLLREAQAMAQLSHPNVVPVYDVGVWDESVFIAMELIKGQTVAQWLESSARPWREVVAVFLAAGEGLASAHRAGLLHRDFKPANILLGEDGRPRVTDFGLARSTQAEDPITPQTPLPNPPSFPSLKQSLTVAGSMMGTPGYMAPEQYRGAATSPAADQFSFCAALYEGLYGYRPFDGKTVEELASATQSGDLRPVPKGTLVPDRIHQVLRRGLSVGEAQRYPSMEALLVDLKHDPARRRWTWAAGSAVAALVFLGAAGTWLGYSAQARVCRGMELQLTGVWDGPAKASARAAFDATGQSFSALAWEHVEAAMNAYAAQWVALRTESCRATRVRGERTEAQLSVAMTCFDRRLDELGTLAGVFGRADKEVVKQAEQAVAQLSPLASCTSMREPPPEVRSQVDAARRALSRGRALLAAGKSSQAEEQIKPAATQAAALGFEPLQAEAQEALGRVEFALRETPLARAAYLESVRAAEAAADDEASARVLSALVSLVGYRLQQPEEGRHLATLAHGVLQRGGHNDLLEAHLAEAEGDVDWQVGETKKAIAHYQQALTHYSQGKATDPLDLARIHDSLGWVLSEDGRFEEAEQQVRLALTLREERLGPTHPSLALSLNNLATLAEGRGLRATALDDYQRALQIAERNEGRDTLPLLELILNVGEALVEAGHPEQAAPYAQRLEAILAAHREATPFARAQPLHLRAGAARALHQPARAVELARQAWELARPPKGDWDPQASQIGVFFGKCLRDVGNQAESLAVFDDLLRRMPSTAPPRPRAVLLAESAETLLRLKRFAEAKTRAQSALAIDQTTSGDPAEEATARFALAKALAAEREKTVEAKALAEKAAALFLAGEQPAPADEVKSWLKGTR